MERIEHLLDRVSLTGFEHKYPRELSGGMQQRASIVRSLAVDPSVLLMDEPFGALDAFTRDEMNLLIQEIWMETGKTIAFVTHSIAEAIFLADRVVVMSARPGRIAAVYDIDIPRPRPVEIQTEPDFIARVLEIKASIDRPARRSRDRRSPEARRDRRIGETGVDKVLGDKIPTFNRRTPAAEAVSLSGGLASLAARRQPHAARDRRSSSSSRWSSSAAPSSCCGSSTCRNTSCRSRARSSMALFTEWPVHLAASPHDAL